MDNTCDILLLCFGEAEEFFIMCFLMEIEKKFVCEIGGRFFISGLKDEEERG